MVVRPNISKRCDGSELGLCRGGLMMNARNTTGGVVGNRWECSAFRVSRPSAQGDDSDHRDETATSASWCHICAELLVILASAQYWPPGTF